MTAAGVRSQGPPGIGLPGGFGTVSSQSGSRRGRRGQTARPREGALGPHQGPHPVDRGPVLRRSRAPQKPLSERGKGEREGRATLRFHAASLHTWTRRPLPRPRNCGPRQVSRRTHLHNHTDSSKTARLIMSLPVYELQSFLNKPKTHSMPFKVFHIFFQCDFSAHT